MKQSIVRENVPRHVAIVMDGNGRWASHRHLPRAYGHKKGVDSVRAVIRTCDDIGVECLTLFAFSSENWKRPEEEVNSLMSLFITVLEGEAKEMMKKNIRLQIIGDKTAFPVELQETIKNVEASTADCSGLRVLIAANYGGRWDIAHSAKQLAEQVKASVIDPEDVNEASLGRFLSTSEFPDLDLFIRTGGEKRVSNFLLWQLAYSELYFSDLLWPDFREDAFLQVIDDYTNRQRRFGMTGDQVSSEKAHA